MRCNIFTDAYIFKKVTRNTTGLIVKTYHDLKEKLANNCDRNNDGVPGINSDWYQFWIVLHAT
jgi:hypothetical protein